MGARALVNVTCFDKNISVLAAVCPVLHQMVLGYAASHDVFVFDAQDGSSAYAERVAGKLQPITNPINPLAAINQQLSALALQLADLSRPILVVGFYPGVELLQLFECAEQAPSPKCEQLIWVVVDSLACFVGFLMQYDASAFLCAKRVKLIWHEAFAEQVDWLRKHPAFPYTFTFLSGADESVLDVVLSPLVTLIQEREEEMRRWYAENEAYYSALSDEQLSKRMSEKGRVMFPTCHWSTVVQYSVRDTARSFERAGWDAMILDSPGMITPYYVIRSIHEFKPDLFLYIGHLRNEVVDLVPRDLLVVTWVQDTMPAINNYNAAEQWNRQAEGRNRDLIIGYTDQIKPYGYKEDRLYPITMIVDTQIFVPRVLTEEQKKRYGCDVCFASNRGMPTDRVVKEQLVSIFEPYGLDEVALMDIHDRLWKHYRAGYTLTCYRQLIDFLELNAKEEDTVVQLLFWRLNDVIYRHVVLEWLDEYARSHAGFKLRLYGKGWQEHPRFSSYACGEIPHGEVLSIAYQAAKRCLHLNSIEGPHQRVYEVCACGGNLLTRETKFVEEPPELHGAFRRLCHIVFGEDKAGGFSAQEESALNKYFGPLLWKYYSEHPAATVLEIHYAMEEMLWSVLHHSFRWFFQEWDLHCFVNKESCFQQLDTMPVPDEGVRENMRCLSERWILGCVCNGILSRLFGESVHLCAEEHEFLYPDAPRLIRLIELLQTDADSREVSALLDEMNHPSSLLLMHVINRLLTDQRQVLIPSLVERINATHLTDARKLDYACALAACGKADEAAEIVRAVYARSKEAEDGYCKIGWQLSEQLKRPDVAASWMNKDEELRRMSPKWKACYAKALYVRGQFSAAEHMVEEAYQRDSELVNAFSKMAWQRHVQRDFAYEKVVPYFEKDHRLGRLDGDWGLNYAQALVGVNRVKDAEEYIQSQYELSPVLKNGFARAAHCRLLVDHGLENVLQWFRRDHRLGRLDGVYKASYAGSLAYNGFIDEALLMVEALYRECPGASNGYSMVGWCGYTGERFDYTACRSLFEKDVELKRSTVNISSLLAGLHAMNGDFDAAEHVVRNSYALNSSIHGGFTVVGFCDYGLRHDLSRLRHYVTLDVESNRLKTPQQCYLYGALLTQCEDDSSGEVILADARSRCGVVHALASSWLKLVARLNTGDVSKFWKEARMADFAG